MKGLLFCSALSWRPKSARLWYVLVILLGLLNYAFGVFSDNGFAVAFILFYCTASLNGGVMMFGERYNWNKYIVTLPVSRKQIILCQHIETAAYELCIYMSLVLSSVAAMAWKGADAAEIVYDVILISVIIISISVSHMVSAAFGGRIGQRCGVLISVCAIVSILQSIYDFPVECAVCCIIAAVIIRAVSIPVSTKLYGKKDL